MELSLESGLKKRIPALRKPDQSNIFKMLPAALASVPFHRNTDVIKRFVAADFPFHLAVHEVSMVLTAPMEYTEPHVHESHDEINIIFSKDKLLYKVQLGKDIFTVSNNSSLWIPKGMIHSANVLSGSGYFITIRL